MSRLFRHSRSDQGGVFTVCVRRQGVKFDVVLVSIDDAKRFRNLSPDPHPHQLCLLQGICLPHIHYDLRQTILRC